MEKRKWPWKKKSSERSPGESESSGSFSSHSERYSDEQEVLRESPNDSLQSPEVTSKATLTDDEVKEAVKSLTEKLSAALVNVSAKEDLVKQHAKVAEEAVAGWEKAENEVTALKQQLEVAVQQNLNLEVRASHLDGALKECVRQLRQAKDEQDKRISDAIESAKADLEKQILNLQAEAEAVDPNTLLILEALEKENSSLKQELASCCKELEIMVIERDLSTQAAENASKLQLDSIRKIAKLEAECRRLQSNARKSTPLNNQKSVAASSFYAESLTDSCKSSNTEANGSEQNFSDTWASALISELDQFKNEKPSPKNLAVEIDMMDDFLEMERLAALSETKEKNTSFSEGNTLRGELDSMTQRVDELENKLANIEAEKLELQNALDESVDSLKAAQSKMEELQKEIVAVNETKELLEFQLVGMEVETRTLSANVDSLKEEIEEERKLSAQLTVKCGELENELSRRIQESEVEQNSNSNGELKVKQEDLAVAADKLAECQQTIASLGRQLESLATLEDFLIDTSNIPGFSRGDIWRLPSKDASMENHSHLLANGDDNSLPNHMTAAKSRNGFGKFFSRSKSVLELENIQD
ncbi:hypothetical protein DH2020_007855 [Rehmannia glutinosa]|uniref:Filament-like plant protein n=1 Tax=Rehmannia glutinosa TaxID=99300 RepID=A0ABR0U068_REHGL